MLKIKDNVDLTELEKFGFKKENMKYGYYFKHFYTGFRIAICKPIYTHSEREIFLDTYYELYEVIDDWNETIFDLIQAGLVEKVGGESE